MLMNNIILTPVNIKEPSSSDSPSGHFIICVCLFAFQRLLPETAFVDRHPSESPTLYAPFFLWMTCALGIMYMYILGDHSVIKKCYTRFDGRRQPFGNHLRHLLIVGLSYHCSPGEDSSSLTGFNCCFQVQNCLEDCECPDDDDDDSESTDFHRNFRRRRSNTCDHEEDITVQCSKSTSLP